MTIHFHIEDNKVILEYFPENGIEWLEDKLNEESNYEVKRVFNISSNDINSKEKDFSESISFIIGELQDDYYKIYSHILKTKFDVLIHQDLVLNIKYFLSSKTSIFYKFEKLANQQIVIGGSIKNSIPVKDFRNIVKDFPTQTEKDYYANAKITNILGQYLDNVKNYGKLFQNYLNKKQQYLESNNTTESLKKYEKDKYSFILEKLREMLVSAESYSEKDWQKEIVQIILLLYPKYIQYLEKVKIKDSYANKNRELDLMLLDSNNCIDIIEIKIPSPSHLIRNGLYRDNHTPQRELSGTIMQVEKYLFHLNKWGIKGEEILTERYQRKLILKQPIKITNPKGLVIIGRDNNLSNKQLFDFEIIKRKYTNIVDIITYDDLIRRLKLLLIKFSV